jgi:hypothetical protein
VMSRVRSPSFKERRSCYDIKHTTVLTPCEKVSVECVHQANYINALAVSVLPFFEPSMPMTLGGLFVTLGGFWYDIG